MRALILAGGDPADPALLDARWPGWREVALVIAADGGARYAAPLGLPLPQGVGAFDSLSAGDADELEAAGVTITRFSANKDATDTELALLAALDAGATEIALLCTWGGRSDHARTLHGETGRAVSLAPGGGDAVVAATGVRWPLDNELLTAGGTRGISNVATAAEVVITVHNGAVLVSEEGGAA